jgi:lipopolysaccharide export system ATP-binding protein
MTDRYPLLQAIQLQKSYRKKKVVTDCSLDVYPGEIVGLLGPNGAGKTTAFYMIMGLIRPDSGSVCFDGKEIGHLTIDRRSKLGIGYLAQEPSIFRDLDVRSNVACVLEARGEKVCEETIDVWLEELHLAPLKFERASVLSGGERRRLEITRALAQQPKLLLLDEPFANVDPKTIEEMKRLVSLLRNKGISVLITDHNAREIFDVADRCYLLQGGEIAFEGSPSAWLESESVKQHYLGHSFQV